MRISGIKTLFMVLVATTVAAPPAFGFGDGTPDGSPPAEERVCDEANLERAAFGLCIAFCEAGDCPERPHKTSCRMLRRNYERFTGEKYFPCEKTETPDEDFCVQYPCHPDCGGCGS